MGGCLGQSLEERGLNLCNMRPEGQGGRSLCRSEYLLWTRCCGRRARSGLQGPVRGAKVFGLYLPGGGEPVEFRNDLMQIASEVGLQRGEWRDFPGGPVVGTLRFTAGGTGPIRELGSRMPRGAAKKREESGD